MKSICIDFDGVLHSYSSGWEGAHIASDSPVPGALEWLREMIDHADFEPMVYSSRSRQPGGIRCMQDWLVEHGMSVSDVTLLQFPTEKPAAWLTIDDRAICFEGTFPTLEAMADFRPWNKRDKPSLDSIINGERTRVRVYLMPGELTNGYCFNGGQPIQFLNVDWFDAMVSSGPDSIVKFIKGKGYYKSHLDYLVVGDHPDFTFRIADD